MSKQRLARSKRSDPYLNSDERKDYAKTDYYTRDRLFGRGSLKKARDEKLSSLQKLWYRALKRAGFKDIEDENGRLIDHQSVLDFQQRIGFREDSFRAIREYYIWAEQMANLGCFSSRRDAKVWRLHSEGKSTREIGKAVGLHWTLVARMIKRIRAELMMLQSTDWDR